MKVLNLVCHSFRVVNGPFCGALSKLSMPGEESEAKSGAAYEQMEAERGQEGAGKKYERVGRKQEKAEGDERDLKRLAKSGRS